MSLVFLWRSLPYIFPWLALVAATVLAQPSDVSTEPPAGSSSPTAVDRFRSILEGNPRKGTAFDRVYEHLVETEGMPAFLDELKSRAAANESNGTAALLLGMVEERRNEWEAAVDAYAKAESLRPNDATVSVYLGEMWLRLDNEVEALAALERAVDRKPARQELLSILQLIAKTHRMAGRTDDEIATWKRLEAFFPDDIRALQEIAASMTREGQHEAAVVRYRRIAETSSDPYQRTTARLSIAESEAQLGRREQALSELESVRSSLRPDSWLYREATRRIEQLFLDSEDRKGLVAYYQARLAQQPDDIDGMQRLAQILRNLGQRDEAGEWMKKAIALAPKNVDLKRTFSRHLASIGRISEATELLKEIATINPSDASVYQDWGQWVLRDRSLAEDKRRQTAIEIWSKPAQARPTDALTHVRTADLFRAASMTEEALAYYEKAVSLAPSEPQYREYLGAFQFELDDKETAFATWKAMAEGSNRNRENLVRLAELYNGKQKTSEAVECLEQAIALAPGDIELYLRRADYQSALKQFKPALEAVDQAGQLAETKEEKDRVLERRIDVLLSSGRLETEAGRLEQQLDGDQNASSNDWLKLARYRYAGRNWSKASQAADQALRLDPTNVPALRMGLDLAEVLEDHDRGLKMLNGLVAYDKQATAGYIEKTAILEAKLGRLDDAVTTAKKLIENSPTRVESYLTVAEFYRQLPDRDKRIETLKKGLRLEPEHRELNYALAEALREKSRPDEAMVVYKKLFLREDDAARLEVVRRMLELSTIQAKSNELIAWLQERRLDGIPGSLIGRCLAEVYGSRKDRESMEAARRQLERIADEHPDDANLLQEVVRIAERIGDAVAAVQLCGRLVSVDPSRDNKVHLAGLLQKTGAQVRSEALLREIVVEDPDPMRRLTAIDQLIRTYDYAGAEEVISALLEHNPDDWELLYRSAICYKESLYISEALKRFDRILALRLPLDTLGIAASHHLRLAQQQLLQEAVTENDRKRAAAMPNEFDLLREADLIKGLFTQTNTVLPGIGSTNRRVPTTSSIYTNPQSYLGARIAAWGWIYDLNAGMFTQRSLNLPREVDLDAKLIETDNEYRHAFFDTLGVLIISNRGDKIFEIAKQLARQKVPKAASFYLNSLSNRHRPGISKVELDSNGRLTKPTTALTTSPLEPLNDDELQLLVECRDEVNRISKRAFTFSSTGVLSPSTGPNSANFSVFREFRAAGKREEAVKHLLDKISRSTKLETLAYALYSTSQSEDTESPKSVLPLWKALALNEAAKQLESLRQGNPPPTKSKNEPNYEVMGFTQWFTALGQVHFDDDLIKALGELLEVTARRCEVAESLKSPSIFPYEAKASTAQMTVQRSGQTVKATAVYPIPKNEAETLFVPLLSKAYEAVREDPQRVDKLVEAIKAWRESSDPKDRRFYDLCLSSVLWWRGEKQAAFAIIRHWLDETPDDIALKVYVAGMAVAAEEYEAGREIVERIETNEPELIQHRALVALSLSEKLKDESHLLERIEELLKGNLEAEQLAELIQIPKRMKLDDLSLTVVARIRSSTHYSSATLLRLVRSLEQVGNREAAGQIMKEYVARRGAVSTNPPQVRPPGNTRPNSIRRIVLPKK